MRLVSIATIALVVPLLVVLLVLAAVREDDEPEAPAEVLGTGAPQRADLPALEVPVPPPSPETDAVCPALMTDLPLELAGERSRRVQSDTPYAYAWGEPPVVLVCGVSRPEGYVVGAPTFALDSVEWYVDDSDPEGTVWTAVDRPVYVQLTVPTGTDSAPAIALSHIVAATMPYQEPQPGG